MSKPIQKEKALILRRKGLSVGDIAAKLKVSKSTASTWCSSIKLTTKQREILKNNMIKAGYAGRQKGADANRKKKEIQILEAKEQASKSIKNYQKETS
ncbi:MAG: hypothetical protein RI935_589 [Candidatus Parcubacteria bacterium]|jgi:orotate phosphoribosyltransferase-like protein